eukprot:9479129-Pyramimonas_sp.AAC.1
MLGALHEVALDAKGARLLPEELLKVGHQEDALRQRFTSVSTWLPVLYRSHASRDIRASSDGLSSGLGA